MTLPEQLPSNVIHIGGQACFVQFYAITRKPGEVPLVGGTFTMVPPNGTLVLDALVGPKGEPGEPAPIMRPQWGSPITEAEDLPDVNTLDESDDGRGWYIHGSWYIYSDDIDDYQVVQGSIPGPPGVTPNMSFSFELVDRGSPPVFGPIEVEPSGTTAAPHFNVLVPAVPGPEGPAGSIEAAADYDDSVNSEEGDFLIKQTDTKWGPGKPNLFIPRITTIPEGEFTAYDGSGGRIMIAKKDIPAREYDWYPDVLGVARVHRKALSNAQFEIEVRIGLTGAGTGENEPLCGLSLYDPALWDLDEEFVLGIGPHFSDSGNPMRAVSPDTSMGRVNAGDAMTIYIFIHKISGSGGYTFAPPGAHLRIIEYPVID